MPGGSGNGTRTSIGFLAAMGYFVLSIAYAVVLVLGFLSLSTLDDPIGDPYFTILEVLILIMCPFIVAVFATIHQRALGTGKTYSLVALVFAALLVGVTACIHFSILTLSRNPEITTLPHSSLVFAFEWPSIVYVLDILAWDVFFALAVWAAVPAIEHGKLSRVVKALFLLSGVLALAGLSGVALNDMRLRNIGILGYVGVFTAAILVYALQLKANDSLRTGNPDSN